MRVENVTHRLPELQGVARHIRPIPVPSPSLPLSLKPTWDSLEYEGTSLVKGVLFYLPVTYFINVAKNKSTEFYIR